VEVIGLVDVQEVPAKHIQDMAVKVWTGQNHFLIHSKEKLGSAHAADRMLRMTAAQHVVWVRDCLYFVTTIYRRFILH
jgi:hypothetical protein